MLYALNDPRPSLVFIDCFIVLKWMLEKNIYKSHSYKGFSLYVSEKFLEKYSYECRLLECYTCGRTKLSVRNSD